MELGPIFHPKNFYQKFPANYGLHSSIVPIIIQDRHKSSLEVITVSEEFIRVRTPSSAPNRPARVGRPSQADLSIRARLDKASSYRYGLLTLKQPLVDTLGLLAGNPEGYLRFYQSKTEPGVLLMEKGDLKSHDLCLRRFRSRGAGTEYTISGRAIPTPAVGRFKQAIAPHEVLPDGRVRLTLPWAKELKAQHDAAVKAAEEADLSL